MANQPDPNLAGSRPARPLVLALLALLVGAASAYAALALVAAIGLVQQVAFGFGHGRVYSAVSQLEPLHVLLAPAIGGLAVGLFVRFVVPGGRNQGPADAMQALREHDGRMSLGAGLGSAAASALAIGCGASLGRYGPSVHLGASVAAWFGERLALLRAERFTLIGCGVAAAISASFSAPLAGVLFAHEVMLDNFARRGFVAITIASVTGQVVARAHDASFKLVSLTEYRIGHNHEYLLFALVGVAGGLLAIAFVRGLAWAGDAADGVRAPGWLKPALGGLALGAVATRFPQVLGLGDEAIHDAVAQLFPLPLLLALLAVKLFAACLCRGFGFPGGVFGPALFLGAMLGSAIGQSFHLADADLVSSVPVYAVAGMGAVTSCVIGAPLTTILIVFELTSSYALTTAVMVAVVLANMTAKRLFPHSWFNLQLIRRGVDLRAGREVRIMRERRVGELLSGDFHTVAPDTTLDRVMQQMRALQLQDLLVVAGDQTLRGQVSMVQVSAALHDGRRAQTVGEIARLPSVVLQREQSLDQAMRALTDFTGTMVPVVDDHEHAVLCGVVFEGSVIGAYNAAVEQARAEERGAD